MEPNSPAATYPALPVPSSSFGPAEILELHPRGDTVRVLRDEFGGPPAWAQLAIPRSPAIRPGATALVAAGEDGLLYVIGLLASPMDQPTDEHEARSIRLTSGGSARIAGPPDSERIEVLTESGERVFEYDPVARRTRLHVRSGDLELVASAGGINLIAADGIRLRGGTTVEVAGELGVRLAAGREPADRQPMGGQPTGGQPSGSHSTLDLQPRTTLLAAPHLRLSATQLDAQAIAAQVTADSFAARARRMRLVSGTFESVVGTLIESANTIVRRVTGLFQLRAAQLHVSIDEHVQLQGDRVVIKADKDVKVLGEQIHLG